MITNELLRKVIYEESIDNLKISAKEDSFLRRLCYITEDSPKATNELRGSIENAVMAKRAYEMAKELDCNNAKYIQFALLNTYSRELKNVLRDLKSCMTHEYDEEYVSILVNMFIDNENV